MFFVITYSGKKIFIETKDLRGWILEYWDPSKSQKMFIDLEYIYEDIVELEISTQKLISGCIIRRVSEG